ncbi:MAG: energy coupling factor transporter S component ThiW [Peptococcaceae bacterium]|nr:energy coupling factor transporter S component ThiW [Peptococcaceae bacterium]
MLKVSKTKKLVIAGLFVAISVVFNAFIIIPIGLAKAAPLQHFMNVVTAVLLGPWYAMGCAFVTSLIRNLMGTGSILAFPGSMVGALLAGLIYRRFQNLAAAACGEVFGTGILGAMLAALMAAPFLGAKVAIFGYIPSFILSSFVGAVVAAILLKAFNARGIFDKINQ